MAGVVTALEWGLYRATVEGIPDQIVMIREETLAPTSLNGVIRGGQRVITDARPLIVLDLDPATKWSLATVALTAEWMHDHADSAPDPRLALAIARQVTEQTKPARIPEPGWGEKVTAHTKEDPERRLFVHWHGASVNKNAWADNNTTCHWNRLIDPTLVREGLS